jgi:hypothetical protein
MEVRLINFDITLYYPDSADGKPASASVNGLSGQPIDAVRIKGAVAGNWLIDDLFLASGSQDFGNARVDPLEPETTVAGDGDWVPSTEGYSLAYAVSAENVDGSQYIEATAEAGNAPPAVSLSPAGPTWTPETIHGTQVNAWMRMGSGGAPVDPALQLGGADLYPYTPDDSDTLEGISAGQIGAQPGNFGYEGND